MYYTKDAAYQHLLNLEEVLDMLSPEGFEKLEKLLPRRRDVSLSDPDEWE